MIYLNFSDLNKRLKTDFWKFPKRMWNGNSELILESVLMNITPILKQ